VTAKRAILALVVVVLLAAAFFYLREQLRIDDCLDGGGRWDYAAKTCDGGT
jgi:hypothetical protein